MTGPADLLDPAITVVVGAAVLFTGHEGFAALKGVLSSCRLCVQDEGYGITPKDRERIFQRFQRAESTRHIQGLGLGLWISRQIAESHGGSLRVESEPGQGSTFILELPRA